VGSRSPAPGRFYITRPFTECGSRWCPLTSIRGCMYSSFQVMFLYSKFRQTKHFWRARVRSTGDLLKCSQSRFWDRPFAFVKIVIATRSCNRVFGILIRTYGLGTSETPFKMSIATRLVGSMVVRAAIRCLECRGMTSSKLGLTTTTPPRLVKRIAAKAARQCQIKNTRMRWLQLRTQTL
jgi:hypothetical protein